MQLRELENWILHIVDRVRSGRAVEDDRIELKAEWPIDHWKAAERIAGHSNAARGENVLWIIGLDETRGVQQIVDVEPAAWWPQVVKWFDQGVAPSMQHVTVPTGPGEHVVALLFDTLRSPFVIKKKEGRGFDRSVPWREGTRIRSATRSDLIRLLVPKASLPSFDVLKCECWLTGSLKKSNQGEESEAYRYSFLVGFRATLYATISPSDAVVMPFHRCGFDLFVGDRLIECEASNLRFSVPTKMAPGPVHDPPSMFTDRVDDSLTIQTTQSEAILSGPGMLHVEAESELVGYDVDLSDFEVEEVIIHLRLVTAHGDPIPTTPLRLRRKKHEAPYNYFDGTRDREYPEFELA